ncbi:unnamed protein product [Orchesella dallaii]|uniref:Uncharacterized protein n=1 Tax=Orchesella dallaii TaxID=48710 RepID=A0ABP1RUY1_9HEXA
MPIMKQKEVIQLHVSKYFLVSDPVFNFPLVECWNKVRMLLFPMSLLFLAHFVDFHELNEPFVVTFGSLGIQPSLFSFSPLFLSHHLIFLWSFEGEAAIRLDHADDDHEGDENKLQVHC